MRNAQRGDLAAFGRIQEKARMGAVQAVICDGHHILVGDARRVPIEGSARFGE